MEEFKHPAIEHYRDRRPQKLDSQNFAGPYSLGLGHYFEIDISSRMLSSLKGGSLSTSGTGGRKTRSPTTIKERFIFLVVLGGISATVFLRLVEWLPGRQTKQC